jgi:hypothetical protein
MRALVIAIVCAATPAYAWPGGANWYWPATGDDSVMYGGTPGGGGILGTGGQHDHGIQCSDCHVQRATESFTFDMKFTPDVVNNTYVAGQTYTVLATMTGANLPCMPGPNGGGSAADKVRNFAASFENDAGDPVGVLTSDAGQTAPNCGLPPPAQTPPAGTTLLDGDCHVIFSQGATPSWTFTWTAPASGTVHVFWGAVDGNCDMMSMGDAVQNGTKTLSAATMRPLPSTWALRLLVAIVSLVR